MGRSFGEVLADFKAQEKDEPENITPLVEDQTLRNGVVAWKSITLKYDTPSDCEEVDNNAKWDWMWRHVSFDMQDFGIVAGLKAQDAGSVFTRLKGLRLIYPDGTINVFARQYMQAIIFARLAQPKRGRPPKEEPKK